MDSTNTGSPPPSDAGAAWLRFLNPSGVAIGGPSEWAPELKEVLVPTGAWEDVCIFRQGQELPISLRRVSDKVRVVAEWPRLGTGHYRLRLVWRGLVEEQTVTSVPQKISLEAYRYLLDESLDAAPGCGGPGTPAPGGTRWHQAPATGGDDPRGRTGAALASGRGDSQSARAHSGIAGAGA